MVAAAVFAGQGDRTPFVCGGAPLLSRSALVAACRGGDDREATGAAAGEDAISRAMRANACGWFVLTCVRACVRGCVRVRACLRSCLRLSG